MRKKRLFAFIIDMMTATAFALVAHGVAWYMNIKMITPMFAIIAWAILIGKDCFNGMSLGKYLVGVQVIDSKTKQIAIPLKCVVRNLFYFVAPIDILYMYINPAKMRLGEYVTRTEVKIVNKKLPKVPFSQIIIAIGYILIGLILMEIFYYSRAQKFNLL